MNNRYCVRATIYLATLSFILHFTWEWFQCVPFFVHRATTENPLSMVMAAIGDVLLTFKVIGAATLLTKKKLLSQLLQLRPLLFVEILAFSLAFVIEKFALATGRWSYTQINPTIPILNVSVLPVLQLMLLTPLIVLIANAAMKGTYKEISRN